MTDQELAKRVQDSMRLALPPDMWQRIKGRKFAHSSASKGVNKAFRRLCRQNKAAWPFYLWGSEGAPFSKLPEEGAGLCDWAMSQLENPKTFNGAVELLTAIYFVRELRDYFSAAA